MAQTNGLRRLIFSPTETSTTKDFSNMASLFFYREVKAFLYVLSFLPFLSYKQFTGLNLDGVSGISPLKKKTKFSKKRKIRSTVIYLWKRLKDSQTFLFFLITETKVLFLQNNKKNSISGII